MLFYFCKKNKKFFESSRSKRFNRFDDHFGHVTTTLQSPHLCFFVRSCKALNKPSEAVDKLVLSSATGRVAPLLFTFRTGVLKGFASLPFDLTRASLRPVTGHPHA